MKKFYQSISCLTVAGVMALAPSLSACAMTQDESVYVKLQPDGNTKEISVVEHLINDLKEQQLFDQSILENIENLNGFETFSSNGEKVTWNANGEDIYYRGDSKKELPIKLDISYKLDGAEKPIDEILGKSGNVEIELKYTNLSKVGEMYTPFVAAMATTLNEDQVSNVTVTNGKATSNGRTIAVAGVATPGLYESIGLDELRTADTVIINFDTENFELNDIYTIVTPKLLDSADLQTFSELDELYTKSNQLSDSSKQLAKGTADLQNGIGKLRASIAELKSKLASTNTQSLIDDATKSQIKTQAGQAAATEMEAKRTALIAMTTQQLKQNTNLVGALQAVGAPVDDVLNQLAASSFELAKQTAITTAENTASNLADNITSAVASKISRTIIDASDLLLAGTDQLVAAAGKLNDGMSKFDREGIQALNNFVNGKVKVTANKIEQLIKLADEYNNYAGISPEAGGTTKFIMMVEGQK